MQSGVGTPEGGVVNTRSGVATPDEGVVKLWSGVVSPDGKVAGPDRRVATPRSKFATAASGVSTPESRFAAPYWGLESMGREVVAPDSKVEKPEAVIGALLAAAANRVLMRAVARPKIRTPRLRDAIRRSLDAILHGQIIILRPECRKTTWTARRISIRKCASDDGEAIAGVADSVLSTSGPRPNTNVI
jgi:hypothetical protein